MRHYKHFEVQRRHALTVVHLTDRHLFHQVTIMQLESELTHLLSREPPEKLLLNFGRVAQCSTEVVNTLLRCKIQLVASGTTMKICGMRQHVREAFQILNLDGTVFDIYDTAAEAIAAF